MALLGSIESPFLGVEFLSVFFFFWPEFCANFCQDCFWARLDEEEQRHPEEGLDRKGSGMKRIKQAFRKLKQTFSRFSQDRSASAAAASAAEEQQNYWDMAGSRRVNRTELDQESLVPQKGLWAGGFAMEARPKPSDKGKLGEPVKHRKRSTWVKKDDEIGKQVRNQKRCHHRHHQKEERKKKRRQKEQRERRREEVLYERSQAHRKTSKDEDEEESSSSSDAATSSRKRKQRRLHRGKRRSRRKKNEDAYAAAERRNPPLTIDAPRQDGGNNGTWMAEEPSSCVMNLHVWPTGEGAHSEDTLSSTEQEDAWPGSGEDNLDQDLVKSPLRDRPSEQTGVGDAEEPRSEEEDMQEKGNSSTGIPESTVVRLPNGGNPAWRPISSPAPVVI